MKTSRAKIHAKIHKVPQVRFHEERKLTSYAGLAILQALNAKLRLKERLRGAFRWSGRHAIYGPATIVLLLTMAIMLGCRRLRDLAYLREDPLLARVVGVRRLPDVATVSRTLATTDARDIEPLHVTLGDLVVERLQHERFARVTVDFDGSVQATSGHAEGSAVGFNPKKKGARSYYPLLCTVAQTDQFFDMLHRPGNVHDSQEAPEFMAQCLWRLGQAMPSAQLETRVDSAFFNELVFQVFQEYCVEFTCSVPFERFPELKQIIEQHRRWRRINDTWSYFETDWKPKRWDDRHRLVFVRQKKPVRTQGPLQLDLFEPKDHEYDYTVIATNKTTAARSVVAFHHGRGSQEKMIGEGKQHAALDVVMGKRRVGNEIFTLAGMLAHNLSRELQMRAARPERDTVPTRAARWVFASLGTLRQRVLHRAGILTRPQGELTITMNANDAAKADFALYLDALG